MILNRHVSLDVQAMPLSQVLDTIAQRGHFTFSYNNSILSEDSPVTVTVRDVPVRSALDIVLGMGYAYVEQDSHLILLRTATNQPPIERTYQVTGYVVGTQGDTAIANASVYVKTQLQSALTDKQGYFKLALRSSDPYPIVSVSKEWYHDTIVFIYPGYDQKLRISLSSVRPDELSPAYLSYSPVEKTWWARFLVSSRQRIQSLNLAHFFTCGTSQVSLLPFLGNHGWMSGQVSNTYSLNLIGGYSAGVHGVEVGGVFNIDKRDVHGFQAAGLLNLVGGNVRGVQVAGLMNLANKNVTGVQAAGYKNVCKDTVRGLQLSSLSNRAHVLKGVQIGLFNVADSSTGYSIGLISIVKHGGIHRVTVETRGATGISVEYVQGNKNLNSILLVGYNPWSPQKVRSYGYGIGKDISFNKSWGVYTKITDETLYDEHFKQLGTLYRLQPALRFDVMKKLTFFAGPTLALYVHPQHAPASVILPMQWAKGPLTDIWDNSRNIWLGFSAGITFL
jgi:hypothetical protein